MTYIEFFDKNVAENICACLARVPERVVLIGSSGKVLRRHAERYQKLLAEKGHTVEFVPKSINKNDMGTVIRTLSEIIEEYDDCVIDLTGGEDVYLTAVGIVCERFKEKKIQMHRFNLVSGTLMDCDGDERVIENAKTPALTVQESVRAYGGDVVYGDVSGDATYLWDMNPEFKSDIRAMWDICKADVKAWNYQISLLGEMENVGTVDGLYSVVSVESMKKHLEKKDYSFFVNFNVIGKLRKLGLISNYKSDAGTFGITYKNEQIKRCLTKAGQVLEMIIYLTACEATEKNGAPVYYDVLNGVRIDWDGEIHSDVNSHDVENEIDVIMMHGIVPVFVSCKNGRVDMNELYKLDSVSERFGGRYARKILVATALEFAGDFAEYFRQRADEMGICIIDNVQDLDENGLLKTVRSFWNRS